MTHIYLDPDGTLGLGLGVLVVVEAPTGVTYALQCAGHLTETRQTEGFIIPVGDATAAKTVRDWFWSKFGGNCYFTVARGSPWTPREAAELVSKIPCWRTEANGTDRRDFLRLDEGRMDECVEAWIPVITPYGRGILTLENSD